MSSTSNFQGKVIWITGASSGIGEEMCYQFSKLGALLIISARNEGKLRRVNAQLPRNPGSALVLPLDLENVSELPSKVQLAIDFMGRIDILVNNAGIAIRDFVKNTEIDIDQKLMNINYFGPVALTKGLLPYFEAQKSGHIVVISSLSGKYGVPKLGAYSAPKHALHGFFESLRSESVESGIFISIVIPGIIQTDITAHAVLGKGENYGKVETAFKNAYPVEKAVKKIIQAIQNHKEEFYVGGTEGFTLWLNRFSPWLLRRFIRNHPLKKMRKLKKSLIFWS
ncbi:SDR family oxidoreductase [Algoriphagus pacificus]|uniref:SDR family oxidoreductase n=1 Tax=Algoriphagus pacificus TaxID=2811234 RepID=A0ABS3CKS0_9BACT|nr:SDR family oxidoreductase [Algoriphagus pacificus]MBN7816766.1 SDR family oxidoreductase [Algoriphagus pacificus]